MKIFRIAQEIDQSSLFIDRRDEGDRIRFVLCIAEDQDEYEDVEEPVSKGKRNRDGILIKKEIGRLVVQFNLSKRFGILTVFWIDPEFRGKSWGRKMIENALNDPKTTVKPILVEPNPFSEDAEMQVPELVSMYKRFGFKPWPEDKHWLIYQK